MAEKSKLYDPDAENSGLPKHIADIALEINAITVKYGFWEVLTALLMNLDMFLRFSIEDSPHCGDEIKRASAEFRGLAANIKKELWKAMMEKQSKSKVQ